MNILKNRKFAWAVLAVVIVLFSFIGIIRTLNKLSAETEKMFYDGVYLEDEGYTSAAINSHLQKRIEASLGLITVISNYDSALTDEVRSARTELLDAKTISAKFAANTKLENALVTAYEKADSFDMSENDIEAFNEYSSTLIGAQTAVKSNTYNDKVDEYHVKTLGIFPASLFRGMVSAPEYFA